MPKTQSTTASLDDIDLQILAVLSARADTTNKALAQHLGLAESTCAHRVRSLRDRGIIRDVRMRLDEAALGFGLQAIIKVRLANHTEAKVTALFDALVAIPRVLQVFHVAGVDDFLVHVAVHDAAALRDIVLEHITVHPVVRGTETQLVFEIRDGSGLLAADTRAARAAADARTPGAVSAGGQPAARPGAGG